MIPIDNEKTNNYYNNLRCGWTLKAPTGKVFDIEIKEFNLEPPDTETGRCYDFLAVSFNSLKK